MSYSIADGIKRFGNALSQNGSSLTDFIEKNYLEKWSNDKLYHVMMIRTTFIVAAHNFLNEEGLLNLERVSLSPVTDPLAHDIEHSPSISYKGHQYKTTHSMIYSKFLSCINKHIKGIFVDSPNIRLEIESPDGIQRGKYLIDFSQLDIELRRKNYFNYDEYLSKSDLITQKLNEEFSDALNFFERLIVYVVKALLKTNSEDLKALGVSLKVPEIPFPRISRDEAVKRTGKKAFEIDLGKTVDAQFFWITGLMRENYDLIYPYINSDGSKKKIADFKSEDIYNYDLCSRSMDLNGCLGDSYEVLSGALREWLYEPIVERLLDNKILQVRPHFNDDGELLNAEELDGYAPFLCAVHAKDKNGNYYFPATYGGGLGVERFLFSILKGSAIKKIDDITFFGKNPDSHPLYLF